MRKIINSLTSHTYKMLASSKFFVVSLGLFILHTAWLALSAYTLPFDEYYHLGIIKIYAGQWSPFISHQPASASYLGDITRLPSYLYHYLMSFPYRILESLIGNEYWVTVILRFINIAFVVIGVILFRRLLLRLSISRRIVHLALFVFMMLPIISLLSAENNYDNLMFLLTPIFLMFALDVSKKDIKLKNITGFLSTGLLACLVKSEFLVLFGLIFAVVIYTIMKNHGHADFIKELRIDIKKTKPFNMIVICLVLAVSLGLFVERYGYNFVKYHKVSVSCRDAQPVEVCQHYSPWARNNEARNDESNVPLYGNIVSYSQHWVSVVIRGFVPNFANVPLLATANDPYGNYEFQALLPLMIGIVCVGAVLTLISVVFNFKKIWKIKWLKIFLFISVIYALVLLLFNYKGYLNTGKAYSIQARYLLPILAPLIIASLKAISLSIKKPSQRASISLLVVATLIYSGGSFGWFIRANQYWYWQNQTIINTNQNIQKVLQKAIIN